MIKGWPWVTSGCLLIALVAAPWGRVAAEPAPVSRAVEVPPPQGWNPNTPLFSEEMGGGSSQAKAPTPRETLPASKRADALEKSRAVASVKDARAPKVLSQSPRAASKTQQGPSARTQPKATTTAKRAEHASKAGRQADARAVGRPGSSASAKPKLATAQAPKTGRGTKDLSAKEARGAREAKATSARGARSQTAARASRLGDRRQPARATPSTASRLVRKPAPGQGAGAGQASRGVERRTTQRQAAAGAKQR